jgi:ABC-2 type transport system ATP-binding protein
VTSLAPPPVESEAARSAEPPPGAPLTLRCAGLRKSFGSRLAVGGVGFEIAPGETYGLLGPNGAGKTTTISMICGLLERDAGEVWVDGRAIDVGATSAKAAIGYVPQDLAIYPDLNARENLRFFGRLQRLGGRELDRRVDEVLDVIGLADRAKDRTDSFSGGMKRRLNIGIGLLHRPRLLVLDEPTVGVDPQSRNAILTSIADLEQEGMAILYTTHYMEEAERLCDRVGIIDEGLIKAEGTRRELIALVGGRDRVGLTASGNLKAAAAAVTRMERVEEASERDDGIDVIVTEARTILPRMLETVAAAGASVRSVEVVEPDLEAVFLHLTGKALRD